MLFKQLFFVCFLWISFGFHAQEDTLKCDQACHCIRNLSPAGVMINHVHPQGEWMVSYRYMQMQMGTPISGRSSVSQTDVFNSYLAYTPSMHMDMHMLMGMYGITNRITLMAMFNLVNNNMQMDMLKSPMSNMADMTGMSTLNSSMSMQSVGLGDSKLHVLVGILRNVDYQLIASAGVSIPNGSILQNGASDDMFYPNSRLPYMMQLGSGTVDFLPGITFVSQKDRLAFSFQSQGTIRLYNNKFGYRLGNEFSLNTWIGYNWWKGFGTTLRLEGNWSSNLHGSDKTIYSFNEISANPTNYGGSKLQGLFGISYQFEDGFISNQRVALEYGLPVYQQLIGIQNQLNQTWMASWSYSF